MPMNSRRFARRVQIGNPGSSACALPTGGRVLLLRVAYFGKRRARRCGRRGLLQLDDHSGCDCLVNQKSHLSHLYRFFEWDGRRFPVADRLDCHLQFAMVSLVLQALELLDLSIACKFECAEIVQPCDRTLAKYLEEFLWDAAVTVSQIKQIGDRPIGELQRDRDVIRRELRAVRQARCTHALNGETNHGARPVHEMTELAHDAAALRLNPMVVRNESGIYAPMDHHGLATAGEELADFLGGRGKPAVETHHHKRSAAGLQLRSVHLLKLSQLFAIHRQRLFDEHWPTGKQCLDCQGRVIVMARYDEYGIDIGIIQQLRGLFCGLKLEGSLRRSSASARDGTYGLQTHALDG